MSNIIHLSRPRGVARSPSSTLTEACALCGADAGVSVDHHVDLRIGYVSGVGQTCPTGCRAEQLETSRSMLRRALKFMIDQHGMQTAREELFNAANELMQ